MLADLQRVAHDRTVVAQPLPRDLGKRGIPCKELCNLLLCQLPPLLALKPRAQYLHDRCVGAERLAGNWHDRRPWLPARRCTEHEALDQLMPGPPPVRAE